MVECCAVGRAARMDHVSLLSRMVAHAVAQLHVPR